MELPILKLVFLVIVVYLSQVSAAEKDLSFGLLESSFDSDLDRLQKDIGYTFKNIGYLRQAMTHASFSQENNNALSILGSHVIESSVSLLALRQNIDVSPKDVGLKIAEMATSCSVDGLRLKLNKVVRVSSNTDPSAPKVVCGAFRAIFGAVAVDNNKVDDAVSVFWSVHGVPSGKALSS
ncbi:hypothetical protein Tsubulata_044775 [Turnera subulata]|uniref:RNase III domain-containing protein n=1 Tax=Turnera subulata TaxID=218843 RepID=A0A9Q0GFC0_9ROSI|nr:hypothetical protein Tsubulata_044775 [Turnera subulata]